MWFLRRPIARRINPRTQTTTLLNWDKIDMLEDANATQISNLNKNLRESQVSQSIRVEKLHTRIELFVNMKSIQSLPNTQGYMI